MKACIFLGPSLSAEEAASLFPATELRPPVRAGDVREALHRGFSHIGIIDGLLRADIGVRHKEILFALSRGVWIYGGGGLGALRAAEMHRYGAIGVGEIFEAYRSGQLEDDDEVAAEHGNAEQGLHELSTAMANIRFGLKQAVKKGVLSQGAHDTLVRAAKRRFYPERSWKTLFLDGQSLAEVDAQELQALENWVAREQPNQRREDAEKLLLRMADDLKKEPGPFQPSFVFEPTYHWEQAERSFAKRMNAMGATAEQQPATPK